MYLADYHLHTNFSADCSVAMENMIRSAGRKGLQEIACTDHVDYDFPCADPEFIVDYDQYLPVFNRLKHLYRRNIELTLGVEIGCQPHIAARADQLVKSQPFDFVICSTHTVGGISCCSPEFFAGKDQQTAYQEYLEAILANVTAFQNYDVCGHLDFITRYGDYPEKRLILDNHREVVEAILKQIITSGHGIEVNTAGYRYGLNQTHPSLEILKWYREMGGEIITTGSDAHRAAHVGANLETAHQLLLAAGFKHFTVFRSRQPYFVAIDSPARKLSVPA